MTIRPGGSHLVRSEPGILAHLNEIGVHGPGGAFSMSHVPVHVDAGRRRPVTPALGVLLMTAVISGQSPAPTAPAPVAPSPSKADAALLHRVLLAHNRVRADAKLPPLSLEPRLVAAARAHADDMARHDTMSHDGSDGSRPSERVDRQGYHYRTTGENVARGQTSAKAVMCAWLKSPPHKKNILGHFTQVGIAVVRSDDDTPFWCVEFGDPWPTLDPAQTRAEVVDGLNREREKLGLEALKADPRLAKVATRLAETLACAGTLDQKTAGATPLDRALRENGYSYRSVSQLLASGLPLPADLVAHLTGSEENRAASLGTFDQVGVGYATTAKGVPYWCVILARPLRK